jgi:CheY-like chemotaxis protein
MPDGGQLKLTLRRLTSDELRLHLPNRLKSKEFVCLVVQDTGSGMSDEIKNRIFEPFYTTKAEGLGTGMGLASVFGFVTQSEGHIRVESQLNKGSSFFIYLPVVSAEGTDTTREEGDELSAHSAGLVNPQSVSIETPSIAGASRKLVSSAHAQMDSEKSNILLVDSHEELRSITQTFLETAGYSIQGVGSASAALIEVAAQDNPVTLMLTDLALPTKDEAVDLIAYCQRAHPEILIGVMTSSSKWLERTGFSAVPMRNVLPKPFSRHELIEFVRQRYAERDQSLRDGA